MAPFLTRRLYMCFHYCLSPATFERTMLSFLPFLSFPCVGGGGGGGGGDGGGGGGGGEAHKHTH